MDLVAASPRGPAQPDLRKRPRVDSLVRGHAQSGWGNDPPSWAPSQRVPAGPPRHGDSRPSPDVRLFRTRLEEHSSIERRSGLEPYTARILPRGSGRIADLSGHQLHRQQSHAGSGAGLPVAGDRNDVRSTRQRAGSRTEAQLMSAELEARIEVPTGHRLGRRALSLGAANAFDYALQFLVPVVLVRSLDTAAFGQYRLLGLAVGTVMAVVTMAVPGSLYYFLPRSEGATKRLYINQALVFLAAAGLIAAWAVSSWNPWLPEKMRGLAQHEAIVPLFVLLWVVASLLDLLPTTEERVMWQAKATVGLAALRAVALSLAAIVTRELGPVLLVLLGFVAIKVALLLGYVAVHHGLRGPILRWSAFADQLRYAAPIGAAGALYGLRSQADQWVAAALFSVSMFASFSIATVL